MEIIDNPNKEKWKEICSRLNSSYKENEEIVSKIFKDVETMGDEAITKYTLKYDNVLIKNFLVSEADISNSVNKVDSELKKAITVAYNNIHKFHSAQKSKKIIVETSKGVECWQKSIQLKRLASIYLVDRTTLFYSFNACYSCKNCRL